jgi:hypothetical protein
LKTLKTVLCISALLVLTASTADAYVRRAVGGGYVARGGYHPVARGVARGAAVAAGTAAVAATGGYGWGGGWGGGWGAPAVGVGAHPWGYDVYGPGGYYGPGRVAAVGPGWGVANRPWTYGVYGPGGSYAPTPVAPVGPGWGPGAQPYQASVYGNGWNYGGDAPGTCYRDCDNYRKALIESGYNPKNYRSAAGTVKQTNY